MSGHERLRVDRFAQRAHHTANRSDDADIQTPSFTDRDVDRSRQHSQVEIAIGDLFAFLIGGCEAASGVEIDGVIVIRDEPSARAKPHPDRTADETESND